MKRSSTIARRLEVVVVSIALAIGVGIVAIVGAMLAIAAVYQPAEVGGQLTRARVFFTNGPAL